MSQPQLFLENQPLKLKWLFLPHVLQAFAVPHVSQAGAGAGAAT
jgi:hypothetical protein